MTEHAWLEAKFLVMEEHNGALNYPVYFAVCSLLDLSKAGLNGLCVSRPSPDRKRQMTSCRTLRAAGDNVLIRTWTFSTPEVIHQPGFRCWTSQFTCSDFCHHDRCGHLKVTKT
ncbi:hypothetical protein PoB_000243500 [Plakobranchus ocellatus]|uniref:Uncharacterized protein n=1 Tax=Plakobranchus ocellatus TaxID=259542 RepID=A0AAV3XZ55_9GAST|nr:hypothetical protein PoB_000243500 [Plakobranchus ocellatus]